MTLSTEAKVGSVVLVGLLLLAYMVIHLGGFVMGDKGYPVQAVFGQVNGLKQGNVVRYAGVEVGRVEAVKVSPEGVQVEMLIKPGVRIPEGARFTITTEGLMGEKYINILPPAVQSGFIQPHAVVRGEDPRDIDNLIANADKVLSDVQKMVSSLNEIIGDEKVKAAMKDSILNTKQITANLAQLSATLARMADTNEGDINATVRNLRAMSESMNTVAARVDNLVASVDNNGQTAADLRDMVANLKSTSARVEKMAAALEPVATDPDTARNIRETLQNARDVSARANTMMAKVSNVSSSASFEMLYNSKNDKYQSNMAWKVRTSPRDFAVIGADDIGNGTAWNFQIGNGTDDWATRAGVIDSKPGIGVDARISKQMSMSLDAYDPNDVRVKLRTKYQLSPDTYLVGQLINKDEDKGTYVGMSHSF